MIRISIVRMADKKSSANDVMLLPLCNTSQVDKIKRKTYFKIILFKT